MLCNHPDPEGTCSQGYALISNQFLNDLPAREVNNLVRLLLTGQKLLIVQEEL